MLKIVSTRTFLKSKDPACSAWAYIGTARGLCAVSARLPEQRRIFLGRLVQKTADAVRDRFVDFIGETAALQDDRVLWYSSLIASKSHSQIPAFNYYVYLKVFEILVGGQDGDLLVVTDDHGLLRITALAGLKDVRVLDRPGSVVLQTAETLTGVLQVARYLLLWCLSRTMRSAAVDGCDVVLQSWVDGRTFSDPSGFHDAYFGKLGGWLQQKGLSVGRVTQVLVPGGLARKLGQRFKEVACPLREVTLSDLCQAAGARLEAVMPARVDGDARMLRVLVMDEIAREQRTRAHLGNLLLFYGCRRLFRGLKLAAMVVYPFENQAWEKMFLLALPAHVVSVGYAHTIIPYNWLDFRISRLEKGVPVPKVLLTIGQVWKDFLSPYYPDVPVEVAGTVRHAYLLEKKQEKPVVRAKDVVVVALPIDPEISIALQRRLLALAKKKSLSGLTVKIKAHPCLPAKAVLTQEFRAYGNCSFVDDNVSGLLADCGLLITSASTVAYESLAAGVRTLVYVPESVSWGIEHFIRQDVVLAYEDDFSEMFLKALNGPDSPPWSLEGFFGQPDPAVFLKYLQQGPA